MKHIYHITDRTGDEIYYHVGIFSSLSNAVDWIRSLNHPICDGDIDDEQILEIRKFELNKTEWGGNGELVARARIFEKPMPDDYNGPEVWEVTIEDAIVQLEK